MVLKYKIMTDVRCGIFSEETRPRNDYFKGKQYYFITYFRGMRGRSYRPL